MREPEGAWDPAETRSLAARRCWKCQGAGLDWGRRPGPPRPCGCVLRTIFRRCLGRYLYYDQTVGDPVWTGLQKSLGSVWSRPSEEFRADFELIARRVLWPAGRQVFRLHYVLGLEWRECAGRLGMDRGAFWAEVDRVERCLGFAYRSVAPYALYPMDVYFLRSSRKGGNYEVSHGS